MAHKVSIYLDDPELRRRLKLAVVKHDTTISKFCQEAIRDKLTREECDIQNTAREAAKRIDARQVSVGPIDVKTEELVKEGRYR